MESCNLGHDYRRGIVRRWYVVGKPVMATIDTDRPRPDQLNRIDRG
jgi:hypothetical protein